MSLKHILLGAVICVGITGCVGHVDAGGEQSTLRSHTFTAPYKLIIGAKDISPEEKVELSKKLILAAKHELIAEIDGLILMGANVNYENEFGNELGSTALTWAAEKGNTEIIEKLIAHDADVDHATHKGYTALSFAASRGDTTNVEALLSHNPDVNHADFRGETALDKAARNGHLDIVKLLLFNGADIGHRDNKGKTALQKAVDARKDDVAAMILDYKRGMLQQPQFLKTKSARNVGEAS